jgi:pyruvate kinase
MMKILLTIGPASLSEETIRYFSQRTNLFRLNGSHSDLNWHQNAISLIRSICPTAFILMDIPGIKPRTANADAINIVKGQLVSFGNAQHNKDIKHVNLTKPLPSFGTDLQSFSLNDGQFIFDIVQAYDGFVVGKSRESFKLLPKKGINLPGSIYDEKQQLEIYSDFIDKIKTFEVDALGISFIQTGSAILELKQRYPGFIQVAKVENSEGWRNISDIADSADAIMIDRGDLAAEVQFNSLYLAVTEIANVTKSLGKPLIMATENLETMVNRESPSKSEVMSLGHSASIGADCIMLSEETALSENGKVIVDWLDGFLSSDITLEHRPRQTLQKDASLTIWDTIIDIKNANFLIMSKSGYAISKFFSVRPDQNLHLLTNNNLLMKLIQLYRSNIKVLKIDNFNNYATANIIWKTINSNRHSVFDGAEYLVSIHVSKYVAHSRANSITIYQKSDFDNN